MLLVILSSSVYFIHYLIFRDTHHIFIYLIGDIGFVFLEVMLVTLILHQLLMHRERQTILKNLNMVVGTFFSEVGTELLKKCSRFDLKALDMARQLVVTKDWSNKEFANAQKDLRKYEGKVDSRKSDIGEIKTYLVGKRQFLLNLLENPNLLEHQSFTNLLWAVFHLTDELTHRMDLKKLPETDYQHLSVDIQRVYHLLILQWIAYMKYLKHDYPYLFSLAMRTNPFDANASIEVR